MVDNLIVSSPSQTVVWDQCPVLWYWTRRGVTTKILGKSGMARIVGSGFSKFMELKWQGLTYDTCRVAFFAQIQLEISHLVREGIDCRVCDGLDITLATIDEIFKKAYDEKAPEGFDLVETEQDLGPAAGNARPDVVFRHETEQPIVREYKFKLALDKRWEMKALDDLVASQQAWHYAWATDAQWVEFHVYVLSPTARLLKTVLKPDGVQKDRWYMGQTARWQAMEDMRQGGPVWEATEHSNRYGPCALKEWCLDWNRNSSMLEFCGLIQIDQEKEGV